MWNSLPSLISYVSSVYEMYDPVSSRDSRGASRRKKDRGLQLRSLLTSRDNKRTRRRMCRLGGSFSLVMQCILKCISFPRI